MSPILIGFVAGVVCFLAIQLKYQVRLRRRLDVIGVHLVGGLVGSLLLGLFADAAVNDAGDQRGPVPRRRRSTLLGDQVVASVVDARVLASW